jgi:hypothetical protein
VADCVGKNLPEWIGGCLRLIRYGIATGVLMQREGGDKFGSGLDLG